MKNAKILSPLISVLVTAAFTSGLFITLGSDAPEPSVLFVYEGQNATLIPSVTSDSEFELTVPIKSENAMLTWFTDRPYRDAGHLSYKDFVALFYTDGADSFEKVPPNVAIEYNGTNLIAEMIKPRIVLLEDNQNAITATFILIKNHKNGVKNQENSMIASHIGRSTKNVHGFTKPVTLSFVSIFVDDADYPGADYAYVFGRPTPTMDADLDPEMMIPEPYDPAVDLFP